MDVGNSTWQLAGVGADASLLIQNVGTCRIAFVIAAAQPADDAITMDGDGHGILAPGSEPMTVKDLDTYTKNMYVRALGPINGKLYIEAN